MAADARVGAPPLVLDSRPTRTRVELLALLGLVELALVLLLSPELLVGLALVGPLAALEHVAILQLLPLESPLVVPPRPVSQSARPSARLAAS